MAEPRHPYAVALGCLDKLESDLRGEFHGYGLPRDERREAEDLIEQLRDLICSAPRVLLNKSRFDEIVAHGRYSDLKKKYGEPERDKLYASFIFWMRGVNRRVQPTLAREVDELYRPEPRGPGKEDGHGSA